MSRSAAVLPDHHQAIALSPRPQILSWWSAIAEVPSVAIGGITPVNAAPLVAAGADFVAVCQAVWSKDDPAAAVGDFERALAL